jgi:fructose-1,6-bisphosphatase I
MNYSKNTNLFVNIKDFMLEHMDHYRNIEKIYSQISSSCKIISDKIKRAAFESLYGSSSITNYHGEEVKTLDIISNTIFIEKLKKVDDICCLISEEENDVIELNTTGNYVVSFDPLDGSSNIDCNVNIGSIFGIYEKNNHNNYLLSGNKLISAGYCLYGTSTILVIAIKNKVVGFTFDDTNGEFLLTHPDIKIPDNKNIYSVNEGNYNLWNTNIKQFIDSIKEIENSNSPYSLRYIGSMVADIHRTLLYGGLFMYPASNKSPNGKLRLLYEVSPMSFIIINAGGSATINGINALEYTPESIHQRVPIFLGSKKCMELIEKNNKDYI